MKNFLCKIIWIDSDIAIPSFDSQKVKVKVADFTQDYKTIGYYNHKEQTWYIFLEDDIFIPSDNVYSWKLI